MSEHTQTFTGDITDLLGNLPVAVFQLHMNEGEEFTFSFVSASVGALMGADAQTLMSKGHFFDIMPEDTRRGLQQRLKDSLDTGEQIDEEVSLQLSDNFTAWVRFYAKLNRKVAGVPQWDGAAIDVTGQHLLDDRLQYLAYYDENTDLPNRQKLEEHLGQLYQRLDKTNFALLALGVDRLDLVQDTLGHETAEQLILTVAEHIQAAVPEGTFIAYTRRGNFSIVLDSLENDQAIAWAADDLLKALRIPFTVGSRRLDVGMSMGISVSFRDGEDVDSLLMNADTALRQTQSSSPGGYRFYVEEMNTLALRVLAYENRLRKALVQKEFVPYFQPLICMRTGRVAGMEALVRWQHPRLGLVMPGEFISVAEEAGLIGDICEQVLSQSCAVLRSWLDKGLEPVPLAVNISWRQFAQPERLLALMDEILQETGVPAELVELELTESSVMEQPDSAIKTLNDLREFGVTASIDDFGTGYSSLAYLKRLPISKLKIDRAFIHEIVENERDGAIVDSIIMLARALGLKIVAEGIESREQFDVLREKGCNLAQGFYFSRPVPADEMEKILRKGSFD